MDSFEKLSELFEGAAGESLLRSQLAMLDLYQQWLDMGVLDSATMNEIIKSAMGAHLALFRGSGEMGQQLRETQHELLQQYRNLLEEHLKQRAAGGHPAHQDGIAPAGNTSDT